MTSEVSSDLEQAIKEQIALEKSESEIPASAEDIDWIQLPFMEIKFQSGPIGEKGLNGTQIEDVLEVLVERLKRFQRGKFPCRENAIAITKLEEASLWLRERTRRREIQGVEGRHEAHT